MRGASSASSGFDGRVAVYGAICADRAISLHRGAAHGLDVVPRLDERSRDEDFLGIEQQRQLMNDPAVDLGRLADDGDCQLIIVVRGRDQIAGGGHIAGSPEAAFSSSGKLLRGRAEHRG